jgi:hypothetical protein
MDKIIFKTKVSFKRFYETLSEISGVTLPEYEDQLKYFKEIGSYEFNKFNFKNTTYLFSELLLSYDGLNILSFKPRPLDIHLITLIKAALIKDLELNEYSISDALDEDTTYRDESVYNETIGINNGIKLMFNSSKILFSEFFSKFRFNNFEWYKEEENDDNYLNPDPKMQAFFDNNNNIIRDVEIRENNITFFIKETEQLRYLYFKFILEDNNIIGLRFTSGSLDLIQSILNEIENMSGYDKNDNWSIYWHLHYNKEDILLQPDASYEDLRDIIENTGTKSW